MGPALPLDCLVHVFSFLEAPDLLRAALVDKAWNEAADTTSLWRNMCLNRWTFCNILNLTPGVQTWKKYYLHRSKLEQQMTSGRPSADYTCIPMRGHSGKIMDVAYLSDSDHVFGAGKLRSVVCTASTDGTVRAWNVQEGMQIWSSPIQEIPLLKVITLPKYKVAITTDASGTIKAWQGETGKELASFSTSSSSCNLVTYSVNSKPFLSAATAGGAIYTLEVPNLNQVSRITAFQNSKIDLFLCSPDKLWLVAGSTESADVSTKVFSTDCLIQPTEDKSPICTSLPIREHVTACWLPKQPARIAVMHKDHALHTNITVLDLAVKKSKYKSEILAQQVTRFTLPENRWNMQSLMEGYGTETILIGCGSELKLYSISGTQLECFQDHKDTITSLWVDSFRVVTSSLDLSLRVYMWKKANQACALQSLYQLLGGSHKWSRGFIDVACDNVSIVGVVARADETSILRAYSFNL
ncbi:PREDICTED: F-box/WD repeat-containing protein 12 isoform X1 [Crocodylus porosus]|uniref:F-box and WD repeat domain containing 12 n=2 Tax=Crocodylus porosus TaxID=8502 RepID=A0A7M4FQH5_CROPO|nr:PREDICTED: F-box/WD repeat-containing protein 12 isoform X1 [Crocodylus porosus]